MDAIGLGQSFVNRVQHGAEHLPILSHLMLARHYIDLGAIDSKVQRSDWCRNDASNLFCGHSIADAYTHNNIATGAFHPGR